MMFRDLNGWVIEFKSRRSASIHLFQHSQSNVPVLGDVSSIGPHSILEVADLGSQKCVLVHPEARGGGCVSCTQKPKKIVPILPAIIQNPNGSPYVQSLAEKLVSHPSFRIYDLETIEPHALVDPYPLAEKLMAVLGQEEFWTRPELYKFRHRLLAVCRKFLFVYIIKEMRKSRSFIIEKLDEIQAFCEKVQKISRDKPEDRDSYYEASLLTDIFSKSNEWLTWLDNTDREGSNLFNAYFGGPPLHSYLYIMKRIDSIHWMPSLCLLMLLDQLMNTQEKLTRDLLVNLLEREQTHLYIVLAYLETLIGTDRISENSYDSLVPRLKTLLNEDLGKKTFAILTKMDTGPAFMYFLKDYKAKYDSLIARNAFNNSIVNGKVVCLPPIFTGPFFGRKKEILAVHEKLLSSELNCVVIYGSPGSGKSRFVYEFACAYQNEYDLVCWVPSDNPEKAAKIMLHIGDCLGLAKLDNIDAQIDYIKSHIENSNITSLFIFEDARVETEVAALSPRTSHNIITTSNELWHNRESLKPLSKKHGNLFFKEKESDKVSLFKGNPICLRLAANLIPSDKALEEFCNGLESRMIGHASDSSEPIFNSLMEESLGKLKSHSERAKEFLVHLSFLYQRGIPPVLYNELIKVLGFGNVSIFIKQLLVEFGFADIDWNGTLYLNKRVTDWVLSDIVVKEPYVKNIASVFYRLVSTAYLKVQDEIHTDFEKWAFQFAHFYSRNREYYRPQYIEAVLYYCHVKYKVHGSLRALWISEFQLGEKMDANFKCYTSSKEFIMLLFMKLSEYSKMYSKELNEYMACLQMQQQRFQGSGAKHIDLADAYHILGNAESENAVFKQALTHLHDALAIRTTMYPSGHLSIATSYEAIGKVSREMKAEIEEIKKYFQLAIDVRKTLLFDYHPLIAKTYMHYAEAILEIGHPSSAKELFQKAIECLKQFYGDLHPDISHCIIAIAEDNDVSSFKESLKILKHFYTKHDACVLQAYQRLANAYLLLGDSEKSEIYQSKADKNKGRASSKLLKPDSL